MENLCRVEVIHHFECLPSNSHLLPPLARKGHPPEAPLPSHRNSPRKRDFKGNPARGKEKVEGAGNVPSNLSLGRPSSRIHRTTAKALFQKKKEEEIWKGGLRRTEKNSESGSRAKKKRQKPNADFPRSFQEGRQRNV
ncbi:hypothetical protein RUM43_012681 [Polyplax serrata]|uniref:Uncharacterized protein n=1 Tax=Polyplax serrata TaxID=468196 RepID=A0AAN8S9P7_POLSC